MGGLERFPRSLRLRKRPEFQEIQERGTSLGAGVLVGLVRPRRLPQGRVGLTVSRKVGNAVVRTGLRRRLRELVRKSQPRWSAGWDVVLVARPSARDASFAELARAFDRVLAQLERLSPP